MALYKGGIANGLAPALQTYPQPPFRVPRGARVALWGDSLTATFFYWAEWVDYVNAHYLGGTPALFFNVGHGSATIGSLDAQADVIATDATHVVFFIGRNDAFFGLPPTQSRTDYNRQLDTVLQWRPTVKFLLLTPWLDGEARPNGAGPKDTQMNWVRDIALEVGAQRGVPVLNVRDLFFADSITNVLVGWPADPDAPHPNAAGKTWLSQQLISTVELDP